MAPQSSPKGKRKRATKKVIEPVLGDWDDLPHGLGKKGDLEATAEDAPNLPPTKRTRSTRSSARYSNAAEIAAAGIKEETQSELAEPKQNSKLLKPTRGHSKKTEPATPESIDAREPQEVFTGGLKAESSKPNIKSEALDNDDVTNVEKIKPAKDFRKKKHPYGLTPGSSPFPNHIKPTPEDCEEVTRLLSKLHGQVKAPDVIPPPSLLVAGCGEVPDLLDAVIRTLLSASTQASNANLSLQGLKEKFGLRTSGIGKGSVNWEAVHKAELKTVIEAIKRGGLAERKGGYIKKILEAVHSENCTRRDALVQEKKTGKPSEIPGAKNETGEQKEKEILVADESMLSLDYVFEMSTDEAMDELTKLPGIGVKTASCVILFCMKRPSFAVDTHVWRHCKWLGWVPEKATRDQTFSHCEVRIPDHLKYPLHYLFLKHGKTCGRCRANTTAGTKEWDDTDCPIDHLVMRNEKRKQPGQSPVKTANGKGKKVSKKAKKGKKIEDETEQSDIGIESELEEDE